MKLKIRHILIGLAISCTLAAGALDLPVRRVNGKDYYVYTVQRNESLLDVANKLDITRDEIINCNPGAADGVKMGQKLYLPVSDFAENNDKVAGATSDGTMLRYKVGKGETLFGIAYRFGVTPDEIAELNPNVNAGVKAGDIIMIPAAGQKNRTESARELPKAQHVTEAKPVIAPEGTVADNGERRLRPVNPPVVYVDPDSVDTDEVPEADTMEVESRIGVVDVDVDEPVAGDTARIALMMPLMLEGDELAGRQSKHSLDFVRGFLLGVRSMSRSVQPTEISIIDTRESAEVIGGVMCSDSMRDVDVIIAPEDPASLKPVVDGADGLDTYILNLFAIQDTTYMTDGQVIQANIPAKLMYAKAAEALMSIYDGYKPVFLISKGGRVEKLPFTDYVRGLYAEMGVEPIDIAYEGMLSHGDLENLDVTEKYVFIPGSGSVAEFNKFARALLALRDDFADPSYVGLFGYPDWTAFRSEALDNLHRLGATVYSRFYNNETNPDTRMFNAEYERQYGARPLEQVPSQAQLGYDTARYLLTNINNNGGLYTPENQPLYTGLQSSFLLMSDNDYNSNEQEEITGGPVNQALYIITFIPGAESVDIKVL